MKKLKLGDIAEIQSGQSYPGKLESDPAGDYLVLNSRAITDPYTIVADKLITQSSKKFRPHKVLRQGDLLLGAKGTSNPAIVYVLDLKLVVASSYFLIIRVDEKIVKPEYIAWYLNHKLGKSQINRVATGATVKNLTKAKISKLSIVVPPLKQQNRIIEIALLQFRQQKILESLREKYKNYYDEVTVIEMLNSGENK